MIIPKISSKTNVISKESSFDPLLMECPPTKNINTAMIAIVGRAPTEIDILKNEPFRDQVGSQFNRICSAVRLARYQLYLTYACKAKLPQNKTTKLWTAKGWKHPAWGELQKKLIDELAEFKGKLILCLGNTAMKLLIDEPKFDSITKYRGSFYPAEKFTHLKEKLAGKIIGFSFNPAFTMPYGKPVHFYTMIADFNKAVKLIDDPNLLTDNTEIKIKPTFEQAIQFLHLVKTKKFAGFDIEATPKFITCFSLAVYDNDHIKSMSIPIMDNNGHYWSVEEEMKIWLNLAEILADPEISKICQNGMFDLMYILRTMYIKTENFYFDTMIAQHICYSDLPKGLDFLTSFYTYYPYYKDEGKKVHAQLIKNWPKYWNYNAKDAAYLLPLMEKLLEELEDFDALDALEYSMELHKPLMEMEWNGILTNLDGIEKTKHEYIAKVNKLQEKLNALAGKELNTNSSKQMIAYFYGTCMIKPYINRKTKNATCDAVALHRIAKKNLKRGPEEARIIIKIRKYNKLLSTYFNVNVDEDKKLRCHHKITGTISGRIATEATYFGTGTNLQNQPYIFKHYLIADPDWYLIEFDLAKAEAHIVAYLCQDHNMIAAFESGVDVHSYNAAEIFNTTIEDVIAENKHKKKDGTKTMRDLGKRVVHASNYDMGPQTFSDQLAKDETFLSQSECKKLLNAYADRFPGLHRWHLSINEEIQNSRILYNLFGRPKRFLGTINGALYRSAYSYIPQSTVAELLNRGLIKCVNDPRLGKHGYDLRFLLTVHDSGMVRVHKSKLKHLLQIMLIIKDHLTHTFTIKGKSFTIGLDFKIGRQWAGNTAEIKDITQDAIDDALEKIHNKEDIT